MDIEKPDEYTLEKTIAFFAIGDEHFVDKELSRYIANTLERLNVVLVAAEKWHKELGPIDGTMNAWLEVGEAIKAARGE